MLRFLPAPSAEHKLLVKAFVASETLWQKLSSEKTRFLSEPTRLAAYQVRMHARLSSRCLATPACCECTWLLISKFRCHHAGLLPFADSMLGRSPSPRSFGVPACAGNCARAAAWTLCLCLKHGYSCSAHGLAMLPWLVAVDAGREQDQCQGRVTLWDTLCLTWNGHRRSMCGQSEAASWKRTGRKLPHSYVH